MHNVSYRGIVIEGRVHNDDPDAAKMWMPAGSYWTQPAGESHITAADGASNLAYIEIEDGPYLVRPADEAFDNGERPINVHASNLVWTTAGDGAEVSLLWQSSEDGMRGQLVKLPAGYSGGIDVAGDVLHGVVVEGSVRLGGSVLGAGGYFGSTGEGRPRVGVQAVEASVVYLRTGGEVVVR
jgi:hypothetical protein